MLYYTTYYYYNTEDTAMATKEQIWTAADELAAEGKKATLQAVRERLGSGSYTDISAAMQTWRSSKQVGTAPIREPAPAAIAERLGEFGGEIWVAALELANGRLAAEREALEQARQEAEQTRQEAADLADQLAAELDEARAEIGLQAEQLAASAGEIEQLRGELHTQTEAVATAVHRADTAEAARAELQARVEQLTALLDREQAAHAKAEAEAKTSGEQCAELRAKLDAAERRAAEMEARANTHEQSAAQARREAENARIAEQSCQARLESATREIEGLRADKAAAEERYRRAADSAARWQGRLETLGAGKTPIQVNDGEDVDESGLKWLTGTPASDVNFKSELNRANAATLRAALESETLSKTARKAIEAALNKLG
jgi:predicted phage tail protein